MSQICGLPRCQKGKPCARWSLGCLLASPGSSLRASRESCGQTAGEMKLWAATAWIFLFLFWWRVSAFGEHLRCEWGHYSVDWSCAEGCYFIIIKRFKKFNQLAEQTRFNCSSKGSMGWDLWCGRCWNPLPKGSWVLGVTETCSGLWCGSADKVGGARKGKTWSALNIFFFFPFCKNTTHRCYLRCCLVILSDNELHNLPTRIVAFCRIVRNTHWQARFPWQPGALKTSPRSPGRDFQSICACSVAFWLFSPWEQISSLSGKCWLPAENSDLNVFCNFFAAVSADEPRNLYTASLDKIMTVSVLFHLVTPASKN